jgi:hypothetical protein
MTATQKLSYRYVEMAKRKPAVERDRLLEKLRWMLAQKKAVVHVHPAW